MQPVSKRKQKVSASCLRSNVLWWITPLNFAWYLKKKTKLSHQYLLVAMILTKKFETFWVLEIIFKSCIGKGQFPSEWKKANVVPVNKKGDKQVSRNYPPLSLHPVGGKYLNVNYIVICLNFILKATQYYLTNQVLGEVTHVYISFHLLYMKFIKHLTTVSK